MKRKLIIKPIRTIEQILNSLSFLEYSTQKRNLAYQIQFSDFLRKLYRAYQIDKSLECIYFRYVVICLTNIIQYLLFVSLRQIYKKNPTSDSPMSLVGQARRRALISKGLAAMIVEIIDKRNKLHPLKQKANLDIKEFTIKDARNCTLTARQLISELRKNRDLVISRMNQVVRKNIYKFGTEIDVKDIPF